MWLLRVVEITAICCHVKIYFGSQNGEKNWFDYTYTQTDYDLMIAKNVCKMG